MKFKEVAISLHFKMYFDCPGVVVDYRTKQEYPDGALNTDILVYEDRVKGWFLNYGHMLQSHHDAGFVVLQIAPAQIEGIKQYRRGESSRNKSSGFFCDGLKRIFSLTAKDDTWLCEFYDLCRCRLFHDDMTRGRVIKV